MLNYNMNYFNKVFITNIHDRTSRYECNNIDGYKEHLKSNPNMVEIIGEYNQQIKPIFDIDAYDAKPDINSIITDINKLFPNKSVKYAKRDQREYKGKLKYSYRFYVLGVRITSKNLKQLIINSGLNTNPIYDMSIYDKNKVLFLPLTTKKADDAKIPPLIPIDCDIFDCCASYIEADYEDWDIKFKVEEPAPKPIIKTIIKDDFDDDEDDEPDKNNKLLHYIKLLSQNRSDVYESWRDLIWCIINICKKENISRRKCYDLIHQFSKLSKDNYSETKVDEWVDKNYDNVRETGYGWTYLIHTCIKEDNPKYYEDNISQSYYVMKKEWELKHTKIMYPPQIISLLQSGNFEVQSINNFVKGHEHKVCSIKEINKKGEPVYKKKSFVNEWLKDNKIKCFEKLVFKPPPLRVESYEFNCWKHFKIADEPLIETDRDFFQEWCDYAYNLIGNKKYADVIIARYAQRIQTPAKRTNICVIYYGEERIGKNKLIEPIKKIMGNYYQELDSAKKLYEKHSMFEFQKLFICVNEAQGIDNFSNADILKTRITEPNVAVNPKGIQPYEIDNLCDYDMTTNNFNVVKLTDNSFERFFQVECTNYYKGNTAFFTDYIENIVNNPQALRQIYEGLMKFDVKSVIPSGNFQIDKPKTEIEEQIKEQNKDKILCFLEDYIKHYILYIKPHKATTFFRYTNEEFFEKWNVWLKECKITSYENLDKHKFGIKIANVARKSLPKDAIIKDTKHSRTILDTEKLTAHFKLEELTNDE